MGRVCGARYCAHCRTTKLAQRQLSPDDCINYAERNVREGRVGSNVPNVAIVAGAWPRGPIEAHLEPQWSLPRQFPESASLMQCCRVAALPDAVLSGSDRRQSSCRTALVIERVLNLPFTRLTKPKLKSRSAEAAFGHILLGCASFFAASDPDLNDARVVVGIAFEPEQPVRQCGPHLVKVHADRQRLGRRDDGASAGGLPPDHVLTGKVARIPVDNVEVHAVTLHLTLRQHKARISICADPDHMANARIRLSRSNSRMGEDQDDSIPWLLPLLRYFQTRNIRAKRLPIDNRVG